MILRGPLDSMPGFERPGIQLMLCALFDFIGMVTYLVPLIGEVGDVLWAPIQALFIYAMVGAEGYTKLLIVFGFTEEILPMTDFIPSCTIVWILKFARRPRG